VGHRNAIVGACAQFDEPLQRRAAALRALLEALREPLAGEAGALDALAAAQARAQAAAEALRARAALAAHASAFAAADAALAAAQSRVLALAEQQRELAADEGLAKLRAVLGDAAQRLGFARQLFNDAVLAYNAAVRQFPARLLAALFGFGPAAPL
ncbi:MAG TPA: LemA family protein, partial [Rubrivivax sp.]|nr:LemA family protein [Rubrivivax sp.]